ncbi:MAG: class F sortase [Chloroflexi bacterium]|nr:class F sortase [Chloroflexota bacterium]
MNALDTYRQQKGTQQRQRKLIIGISVIVALLLAAGAIAFIPKLFAPNVSGSMIPVSGQVVRADSYLTPNLDTTSPSLSLLGASQALSAALPDLSNETDALLPESHLTNAPLPQFVAHSLSTVRGPQSIRLPSESDGGYEEHLVSVASFSSDTDVSGAAGEWRVIPWWQPGWIPESVDCGEPGNAIIAGHVSWYKRPGPFQYLGALTEGGRIDCQAQTGEWHSYVISSVVRIEYADTSSYWGGDDETKTLTLYTCTPEITGILMLTATLEEQL